MARWFDFSEPEYHLQELGRLRMLWRDVPDQDAVNAVAEAHQYYSFLQDLIINRLQSWSKAPAERPHWHTPTPLILSTRAGAVSSSIVVGASIVECAMRAHAENRNLKKLMKKDPKHRTFGSVIYAWENHGVYGPEIAAMFPDLKLIHGKRNDIHLYASFGRNWEDVEAEEQNLVNSLERLFVFFQQLKPKNL